MSRKKKLLLIVTSVFLFSFIRFVKEKYSTVIYKIGKIEYENKAPSAQSEEKRKKFIKTNEALNQVECKLYFNKDKSIFKLVEKLDLEKDFSYRLATNLAKGIYYTNNTTKQKIVHRELGGSFFNIKKEYASYKWNIGKETKIINGFKCYRATCIYEEFDKLRNKHLIFTPEVWFTPEINCSFGPKGLEGLPGLILEAKMNDKIYFYATNINLNSETLVESFFDFLSKGKEISEDAFQDYSVKLREMRMN